MGELGRVEGWTGRIGMGKRGGSDSQCGVPCMIGEMEKGGSGVKLGCRGRVGEIEVGSGEKKV